MTKEEEMNHTFTKPGFTLLEVIFVIVILGIVASIGSTIVAQLYDNYIVQRAVQRVSLKTELAADQIANRLADAIPSSIIARNPIAVNYNFQALRDIPAGAGDRRPRPLEWIGYEHDSFAGSLVPGWSGYCDIDATQGLIAAVPVNRTSVITPGSNLPFTNQVIQNLSGSVNNLADAALLFNTNGQHSAALQQTPACYGYDGNTACIYRVAGNNGSRNIRLDDNIAPGNFISPLYKIAWSAYAIVPTNIRRATTNNSALFDLELRYGYQPWNTANNNDFDLLGTNRSILLRNVTSFKFAQQGNTIRFKICATEQIGGNAADDIAATNISVCKEKVVIR